MGLAFYDRSVIALVVFGLTLQLIAAVAFFWLRGRLKTVPASSQ